MPVGQTHIGPATPMGASLVADGSTFRFWAPRAISVYLVLNPGVGYHPNPEDELVRDPATGHWTGFVPGVADGTPYRFFVVGTGGAGFKRDPWTRELANNGWRYVCVVRGIDEYS